MTDADRDHLSGYLRDLADRMGLKDWTFKVLAEPADPDCHAEIRCAPGRKFAEVKFDRDWADRTAEELRHTCCHELLHCHHAATEAEMRRRLNKADYATFEDLHEYAVDGTADALAPHLPLPLWTMAPEPERTPEMGRQKPKPIETAETKPKARPKGKGKPDSRKPAK